MKVLAISSILILCPAAFAQMPPDLPYNIFLRDRPIAGVVPPRPEIRPAAVPASFTPVFVGVIKDENGYVGLLLGQTDVTPLKIGDTLAWNRLKIVDLNLTRMLLSDSTSIPIGSDLLNRPHYLPAAPVLAPTTPPPNSSTTGRVGRSGNNPFGNGAADVPTAPNQPNPTNRFRGGLGAGAGFGAGGAAPGI
jgi:hypothetical protein